MWTDDIKVYSMCGQLYIYPQVCFLIDNQKPFMLLNSLGKVFLYFQYDCALEVQCVCFDEPQKDVYCVQYVIAHVFLVFSIHI